MKGDEKMNVIAVTGATGGMGQALCEALTKAGFALAICGRDNEKLKVQEAYLRMLGKSPLVSAAFDLCDEAAADSFFSEAEEKLGKIDALVHLAGLSIPTQMDTVTGQDFDRMMDANVKSALIAAKYYAKYAVAEGGLIVNLGSMAARRANGSAPLYCAAKAALNMMSAGMQMQLAEKGIRVTTLNPGGTDTPFWGDRKVDRSRMFSPQDVIDVILFVLEHPRIVFHSVDFESTATIG